MGKLAVREREREKVESRIFPNLVVNRLSLRAIGKRDSLVCHIFAFLSFSEGEALPNTWKTQHLQNTAPSVAPVGTVEGLTVTRPACAGAFESRKRCHAELTALQRRIQITGSFFRN